MIVTLSDYIMEQDVSTASCDDIYFEQLAAEINVHAALANAYAKQVIMLEYTMEADGASDTKTEKKSNKFVQFFKNIWEGLKNIFKFIKDKIVAFFRAIKQKFSKKALDEAEKIADNGTEEEVAAVVNAITTDYTGVDPSKGTTSWEPAFSVTVDASALGTPKVEEPKKPSALELLISYDVSGIYQLLEDIDNVARSLEDKFVELGEAVADSRDNPGFNLHKITNGLEVDIQKLAEAVDKLQMRQMATGQVEVGKDKRSVLKRMIKFVKEWESNNMEKAVENFSKDLDELIKAMNTVGEDKLLGVSVYGNEDRNIDPQSQADQRQVISKTQSLLKTMTNLANALNQILLSTGKLAGAIQKEVHEYQKARVHEMSPAERKQEMQKKLAQQKAKNS